MNLLFDIETNGLYWDLTHIHCLVIRDLDTGQTLIHNDQGDQEPISRGITLLEEADRVIGHNVIGFDIPVIEKIYPWFSTPPGKVIDTMVLSQLRYPDMLKVDIIRNIKGMPRQLWGRHSLEAWGYRLQCAKGEFGKTTDWANWSQEMQDYCVQDTLVTHHLWHHFRKTYPGLI